MQNLLKQKKKSNTHQNLKNEALNFITIGIGCNCLVALSEAGVLAKLLENRLITAKSIAHLENPTSIKSALVTLEKCNVVKCSAGSFKITHFGRILAEYIGLIKIFFDGYSGLVANQSSIVKKKMSGLAKLVNWPAVSESSIWISEKTVIPALFNEFKNLQFSGTICDLGCGHGVTLSKVCTKFGKSGLGFESNHQTVSQARKQLRNNHIAIERADVTNLKGVWEDIVILMQCLVFHDFNPSKSCVKIINSYLDNFPNLKYFFYVDMVAPSNAKDEILPGFDYVHGLLGVSPRTYEETIQMFEQSKYNLVKEVPIKDLPNTYLWLLSPKRT